MTARPPSRPAAPPRANAVVVRRRGNRTAASRAWLQRQLNDPYVQAAQSQGLRSRAAFKLMDLDDRFALLRPGLRVLDLGAAPGGWAQVAVARGAVAVVGIDLLPVDPLPGAIILQGDMTDPEMLPPLLAALGGAPDLVLSDMAPNTTGHAATDHLRIIALAELAAETAMELLSPGGAFVTKLFAGGAESRLLAVLKRRFAKVRHAKPPASRKDSSELYLVATGFRPD